MRLDHTGKIQSASLISATDTDPEEETASEAAAVHGQVSLGASA